nr:transcriptional regulatory protein rxt3 [Quercus suber]
MPPPPSSPQMLPPPNASSHHGPTARGPPITSPFAGAKELASLAAPRPATGMSISSMLGGPDEHGVSSSPRSSAAAPSSASRLMHPPSPGRARSSSMREGRRGSSPHRNGLLAEPRAATAFHERGVSEPRKDGVFESPQLPRESVHSFRNFQAHQPERRAVLNGAAVLGRPSSQPVEPAGPRTMEEMARRQPPEDARFGLFRQFGEPTGQPQSYVPRVEVAPRPEAHLAAATSQPRETPIFGNQPDERDLRNPPFRFQSGPLGTPMREDQAGLFRPSFQHAPDVARESIESRMHVDSRRAPAHTSSPMSEMPALERSRVALADRPMTFEEHQRMEASQREQLANRKESDGSVHRAVLNLSPELSRKGRNTPQPQAIQGAQPRQSGPTKDNPRLNAFGRMFSGLGSGAGSATPTPGQDVNGSNSPSRVSPSGHMDDLDTSRYANHGAEQDKANTKASTRGGKKGGRRTRDDAFKAEQDGRGAQDHQRGGKRPKSIHHHHHHSHAHHHHHHHEGNEAQPGSFNMLRFPSNSSLPPSGTPVHHHHHVAPTHNHPSNHHHHHHAPRPVPARRRPTLTVHSQKLLDSVKEKPRGHLGSQLYTTKVVLPHTSQYSPGPKITLNSESRPLPKLEDKENCTFTVRVPRWYVATRDETAPDDSPTPLEVVCKTRQLWGTDVYTDDSDVLAAAVHSGWIRGDFGELDQDLQDLFPPNEAASSSDAPASLTLLSQRPEIPRRVPADHDVHITLLILPPLQSYVGTMQNHIRSREWGKQDQGHDGMSFMIHQIEFVDESGDNRFVERGIAGRKQRLAMEEVKRREAAAGLVAMFASASSKPHAENGVSDVMTGKLESGVGVRVGA